MRYVPRDLAERGARMTWDKGVELAHDAPLCAERSEALEAFADAMAIWAEEHRLTHTAVSEQARAAVEDVPGQQFRSHLAI